MDREVVSGARDNRDELASLIYREPTLPRWELSSRHAAAVAQIESEHFTRVCCRERDSRSSDHDLPSARNPDPVDSVIRELENID